MPNYNLIIFLKYPEPEKVKTRLGNTIGYHNAAKVYSSIVKHLLYDLKGSNAYTLSVFYSPPTKLNAIKNWIHCEDIELVPQIGYNLGEKISNAFEHSFSKGFSNTIVIGSDCIELNKHNIETAFRLLSDSDNNVILGPATDGGYYLIGQHISNNPELFNDIEWSTDKVFFQTTEKLESLNLKYFILDYYSDIDELSDINGKVIKIIKRYDPELKIFN